MDRLAVGGSHRSSHGQVGARRDPLHEDEEDVSVLIGKDVHRA